MARVRRSGEGNDLQADDRVADLQHEVAVARVEDADFQLSGETGIDVQLIRGDCAEPREMRRRAEPCEMVDRQGQAFARDDAHAAAAPDTHAARPAIAARRRDSTERQFQRGGADTRFIEAVDIDHAVFDRAHDLVADEDAGARRALRLRRIERVLEPVVGVAPGQPPELRAMAARSADGL